MERGQDKLERLERRLRGHGGVALSGAFKRNVMDAVARLPEPQAIAPASPQRGGLYLLRLLTTGEKVIIGAVLVGLAALCLPGALDWIDSVGFSLSNSELALSIGDTVLSASVLSVIAFAVVGVFLMAFGAYGSRNKLLGA